MSPGKPESPSQFQLVWADENELLLGETRGVHCRDYLDFLARLLLSTTWTCGGLMTPEWAGGYLNAPEGAGHPARFLGERDLCVLCFTHFVLDTPLHIYSHREAGSSEKFEIWHQRGLEAGGQPAWLVGGQGMGNPAPGRFGGGGILEQWVQKAIGQRGNGWGEGW